jgi:hypothetical protein
MSTQSSSFLERLIRAITRGAVPIDASQCDGPCVVQAPADATKAQCDGETERRDPIRWLSLR